MQIWEQPIEPQLAREILSHKRSLTPHSIKVKEQKLFAVLLLDKRGKLSYEEATVEKSEANQNTLGICPVCTGDVVVGAKAYGCSNWRNGCKFVIWKTMAQREISEAEAKQVLENGVSAPLQGFKSKAGNDFEAKLKVVNHEVKFEFS